MSTILITGCSSGFGLETARYFLDRDWTVIATMRAPCEGVLPSSERLSMLTLDVTDPASIQRAVADAGPIDALVNNAGVGLLNALEGITMDMAREAFETNTLGTIAMTKAVVPQFRERGAGVIVSISSAVTLRPLPFLSVYTASKAAVNAFTESLGVELAAFGVRTRIVIPGRAPETSFGDNARSRMGMNIPDPYADIAAKMMAGLQHSLDAVTRSTDVAEAVWCAVTDLQAPMRLPAGADAVAWAAA